jgi:hypothetical protein
VLVELHNRHVFEAGLIVVGTLAYMSWLNEYGAIATAARTQDIDLARGKTLKLAATLPFLSSMMATQLPFHQIPGLSGHNPSTSVKLRGTDALHVDILAPGPMLGGIIEIPELDWHAQTIPFYDYLLEDAHSAAMLAGGHCISIKLPNVRHMVWHKLEPDASSPFSIESASASARCVRLALRRLAPPPALKAEGAFPRKRPSARWTNLNQNRLGGGLFVSV